MALSVASSSSEPATHRYHVFISFRGEDTRKGFLSHLQAAFQENQITTFRDDGMEKGAPIWDELVEAITNSKFFLVILSKNYASSRWCLNELVKIMECKNKNEHVTVIPVFYGIQPTHIRNQTGTYHTAFTKHEGSSEDPCHVQQWRTALTQAADLSGFPFNEHRDDEANLISEIVKTILPHRVNIKYYMDGRNIPFICNRNYTHLESLLMRRKLEEVVVIGIWGMGGIGKSTIAERLFNKYSCVYEGSCFLSSSRELASPCLNNICNILLSQLLNQDLHITNIEVLDSGIVRKLRQRRVFVVLDDVVDSPIVTDLVPFLRTCLRSGSIVILTARDRSVLTSGGVQQIHEIERMSYGDSHELLSHYAFSDSHPKQGYDELTERVINYASGIPLALKILGSFLRGKSASEWDSALKKLRKCPNKTIQQVLRLSYDGLDDEEKKILLDIACFFGDSCKRDSVIEILNSCEFSANIGIKNLLDKALISTTSDNNYIKIHGLIRKKCWEIVHEEARRNGGQTRIWDTEELCNVLENKKVSD
ncbi:hypothetical protein PIB30_035427 [Stylosanthes scabra]|uniref:TIR domain-containing protein n=1 Tax=Stylosanthes scabra TaxID=79078 RepID=A0ABU6RDE5_9FABA|nr:hypothetical protein [Stylosanthes scabra]